MKTIIKIKERKREFLQRSKNKGNYQKELNLAPKTQEGFIYSQQMTGC